MGNKKTKINILIILIVIFLITTVLMIRFEFNPISFITGGNNDKGKDTQTDVINYNGVYRYKESLDKTYKMYMNCSLTYFDYYIVILNGNYYRYKSSCLGTFLLGQGKANELVIEKTLENNIIIKYEEKNYLRTDLVNSVVVNNYAYDNRKNNLFVQAENYNMLLQETQDYNNMFNLPKMSFNSNNARFSGSFKVLENNEYVVTLKDSQGKTIYTYNGSDLNKLPILRGVGANLSIIEPIEDKIKYQHVLRLLRPSGLGYDLRNNFPIIVDGDVLTYDNSIYVKYSLRDNVYVMLIGDDKKFCKKDSNSTSVAYYIFHIEYDHVAKDLSKPKFIKKVLKNDPIVCEYVENLMEE